ncbi:MAG TPA: radical SAM protein [bacterium]|nr:radical SAM protein [bacterium]HPN42290.1 radical SAM protein [bacterium]
MTKKQSLLDKIDVGLGKEVAFSRVVKALTLRRLLNIVKITSSFIISAMFKKSIVWGVPPIVNIEPTNICNLKCPLCVTGSGQMLRPRGKMDFTLMQTLVDEMANRILYITLYSQGEPYLHPRFNEFVRYAKNRGVYVNTSTNAHYFDMDNARAVVKSGLDSMIISLDGVTPESYSRYRVNGNLDTVLKGIRNLVAAKAELRSKTPYLFLQFLVMRHNESEIPAIKQLARELGVNRLLIKTTQVMSYEEAVEWLPDNEKYRRYTVSESDFKVKKGKGACPRPWFTTLVDWDGLVVPCCFDKNGDHALGNMNESDFMTIWQGKKYRGFRSRLLRNRESIEICRNCNFGIGIFK